VRRDGEGERESAICLSLQQQQLWFIIAWEMIFPSAQFTTTELFPIVHPPQKL